MLQLFTESADFKIPKLSETAMYAKFNTISNITENVGYELSHCNETLVSPESIKEILSLIKLNGDTTAKKAVDAYLNGDIKIIFNNATSKVPTTLPYIITRIKNGKTVGFIFADKFMNKIDAPTEYSSLMAVMEATYLALLFAQDYQIFLMNSQLVLSLCNIYVKMAGAPLFKIDVSSDNRTKICIYLAAYFYMMCRGSDITAESIPFKRILNDNVAPELLKQITEDVMSNPDKSFMGVVRLIKKINPIRYEKIEQIYVSSYISTVSNTLLFALENISYLFLLVTSAVYKSRVTGPMINNQVIIDCRKSILLLSNIVNSQ